MKKKYNNQDLVSLDIFNKNGDIRIKGLKNNEVRDKILDILDKIKSYKPCESWDDIVEQLDNCSEFCKMIDLK